MSVVSPAVFGVIQARAARGGKPPDTKWGLAFTEEQKKLKKDMFFNKCVCCGKEEPIVKGSVIRAGIERDGFYCNACGLFLDEALQAIQQEKPETQALGIDELGKLTRQVADIIAHTSNMFGRQMIRSALNTVDLQNTVANYIRDNAVGPFCQKRAARHDAAVAANKVRAHARAKLPEAEKIEKERKKEEEDKKKLYELYHGKGSYNARAAGLANGGAAGYPDEKEEEEEEEEEEEDEEEYARAAEARRAARRARKAASRARAEELEAVAAEEEAEAAERDAAWGGYDPAENAFDRMPTPPYSSGTGVGQGKGLMVFNQMAAEAAVREAEQAALEAEALQRRAAAGERGIGRGKGQMGLALMKQQAEAHMLWEEQQAARNGTASGSPSSSQSYSAGTDGEYRDFPPPHYPPPSPGFSDQSRLTYGAPSNAFSKLSI
jgi:hypothetical protein